MGSPSEQLKSFMSKYKIDADEIWQIPRSSNFAIKHSALERVAAEQKIAFDVPHFAEKDGLNKNVAMLVVGKLGDRSEWSVGEASPHNYRTHEKVAAYPYAIAEKRAKDRVILKLLNISGSVYSDAEADEFEDAKRQNPHVTRPTDIVPDVEYDQNGHPVDNIPLGDSQIETLPKAKARTDYAVCQQEMRATKTPQELEQWGKKNANRIASFPSDWAAIMRGQYSEHMSDLRNESTGTGRAA